MVSLRDGKSYDTRGGGLDAASDPAAGPTSTAASSRRRTSTVGASAKATKPAGTRRSTRANRSATAQADPTTSTTSVPEVPASPPVNLQGKRFRTPAEAEAPDTSNRDVDLATAALASLPNEEEEEASPSPVPKKKPRVQPTTKVPPARGHSHLAWLLVALLFTLAAAAGVIGTIGICNGPYPAQLQPVCVHVQPAWRHLTQERLPAAQLALAAATGQLQQQAREVYWQVASTSMQLRDQLQTSAEQLLRRKPGASPASHPFATEVLAALVADTPAWQAVAADVQEALRSPGRQKALSMLLTCASRSDCGQLQQLLLQLQPAEGCTLTVSGAAPGQPAGQMQALLASFWSKCPTGLLVVTDADQLSPGWWPVLTNALSELGGFEQGGHVDATQGLVVLLQQLPAARVADAASNEDTLATSSSLKQRLVQRLMDQGAQDAVAKEVLRPLRRRIDFAAPTRTWSTTGEAQGPAGNEGAAPAA